MLNFSRVLGVCFSPFTLSNMSSLVQPIRAEPNPTSSKLSIHSHHEPQRSTDSSHSSDSHITVAPVHYLHHSKSTGNKLKARLRLIVNMKDLLDSAEKWITQQLLFHEYVTAYDLLEQFDVTPKMARILISRFERRMSS